MPLVSRVSDASKKRFVPRLFDAHLVALLGRRDHMLCIGDSHVAVFEHVRVRDIWFQAFEVGGATASGILNPNSATQGYNQFTQRLDAAPRWQHIIVVLGEVDCGFLIWHRAQRDGACIDQQLTAALDNYLAFLRWIKQRAFASLSVLSVPLPTIEDYSCYLTAPGDIANARKEVTATQRERTELTIRFNQGLCERAAAEDIAFLDATSRQVDPSTGLIDRALAREDLDHHLRDDRYAELIAAALVNRA